MKILTIEIPDDKTEKLVKELLASHGISLSEIKETSSKLTKEEQDFEDKVDRNLAKAMQNVDLSKTVKESTVMRNLRK